MFAEEEMGGGDQNFAAVETAPPAVKKLKTCANLVQDYHSLSPRS